MADGEPTLRFDFKPAGQTGRGILVAHFGDDAVHTQRLDLADADARAEFLKVVCNGREGIDTAEAARALESMAGGCVDDGDGGDGADDSRKASQAQVLVSLAEGVELFHDGDVAYAGVDVHGHREHHPLAGKGFRLWLSERFYRSFGKAAGSQAMQDALNVLAGKALFDGPQASVAVRLARRDGAVYLDLADEPWRAVRVTRDGWEVVDAPPVKFLRRRGMLALPVPVAGGSLAELRPLINAGDDANWILAIAWVVGALSGGPYPILDVNGEQGSGKSTFGRMIRRLIDPNVSDLRSAPREERDLVIAASNSWVVAFDNLSTIPPSLSDCLCRLATGGGFGTRELYSNDEEKLFDVTRPVMFNGIEELATRPDLLERTIRLNLPPISEDRRTTEAELWERFEGVRPRVLGTLLDAVVTALQNLASVRLERRPRIADFAQWVVAAEPALPWPDGQFLDAYIGSREAANELAIEASAVGPATLAFVKSSSVWEGTASDLLHALEVDPFTDQRTRQRQDWPKTPKAMSNALRRIAPALRAAGVRVAFAERKAKACPIVLEWAGVTPSAPSPTSSQTADESPEADRPDGSDGEFFANSNAGANAKAWRPPWPD